MVQDRDMSTIETIAQEHGIDATTARIRCEGLTIDHLSSNAELSEGDASLIRAWVAR